ncbi:MAG TPA: hypothetical protein VI216_11530 [Candidatus Acidoferrales bacterium]
MRKLVPLAAVAIVLGFAGGGRGQESNPASSSAAAPAQTSASPSVPQDSLAEAARKARKQKKEEHTTPRVFTNDNLPTSGGISTVGQAPAPAPTPAAPGSATPTGKKPGTTAASPGTDETKWREKFAALKHKLEQDQQNLDIAQRELGTLNTQFYSDPNKQMQQQLTRSDINDKTAQIDKLKAQVAADQQAISDAQDDLRKAGGDPGWAQ